MIRKLENKEILYWIVYSIIFFILLWTLTSLWDNLFFTRMTNVKNIDFIILSLESLIIWFYLSTKNLWKCDYSNKATIWWIFWFLWFGCLVCNKILLLTFWATFLLSYIEPIKYYIWFWWIIIMWYFLYKKLQK
jgi:hypothetical protein